MTSRERLLAALDHRRPDRVPIDLGGNQTGIHNIQAGVPAENVVALYFLAFSYLPNLFFSGPLLPRL